MIRPGYGWQVRLHDNVMHDAVELVIWRERGDHVEVITGFDATGAPIIEDHDPRAAANTPLPRLPRAVLTALGEQLKPGPTEREHAQLFDALELERRRVDRILDRLISDVTA